MINKTDYYNWQNSTKLDRARFGGKASPNIMAIKEHVMKRFGGRNLGVVNKRKVRGGTSLSSHYFGAAWDWRYDNRKKGIEAIEYLIQYSQELGVQMIVDYVGGRIWSSSRAAWKKAKPSSTGMGQAWASWIHVETTKTQWGNSTPVADRIR